MTIKRILRTGTLAPLFLAACSFDGMIENSRFNKSADQLTHLETAEIFSAAEFSVDPARFINAEFEALGNKAQQLATKKGIAAAAASAICKSPFVTAATLTTQGIADRVAGISIATSYAGLPGNSAAAFLNTPGEQKPNTALRYADFERFRLLITDAMYVPDERLKFAGAPKSFSGPSIAASMLLPDYALDGAANTGNVTANKAKNPLLAYLGPYYRGKFVDRFGKTIEKPDIKSGIDDGTMANFVRIFLEAVIDSADPRQPILISSDGKTYYPGNTKPTFLEVYPNDTQTISTGGKSGISAAEAKVLEAGAKLIADQALVLFSGFFEFLGGIDIGFVVMPNFTVGSNGTLKAIARSVIETSVRRGAERGLFCLVEKYDFDTVAEVIGD